MMSASTDKISDILDVEFIWSSYAIEISSLFMTAGYDLEIFK